ncbi:MAG: DNA repair protein RecO [Desulfarculales bacterium]|jgi:DNA repair protein RecO (recombination protein O)|nr:DNA repair protein RecO [Desulfarculales bacterium]
MNPDLGIVLRLRPWKESDVMLDMFTDRQGRIIALAKGAQRSRRRFVGLLLNSQLLEVELKSYQKSNIRLLSQARMVNSYPGLHENYQRWLAAGLILDLLLKGTPYLSPLPEIMYLAVISLKRIAQSSHRLEQQNALLLFVNRFLQENGFGLYLERCLFCGRKPDHNDARLSLNGGLACGRCRPRELPVSQGLINTLSAGQRLSLDWLSRLNFTQPQINRLMPFMAAFARQTFNHDLLSFNLLI